MGVLRSVLAWIGHGLTAFQSPRPGAREDVMRSMKLRPSYSKREWQDVIWKELPVSSEICDFLYDHLPNYLGLESGRLLTTDRLVEDLRLRDISWHDWEYELFGDFKERFQTDITHYKALSEVKTIGDLGVALDKVVRRV